jgi:sensor histidine kinase regulating citrate/malate metabolism
VTTTFLILSIIVNIVAVFYARWLIQIIRSKEEDVSSLAGVIAQYVAHVKSVHDMEMFYGDQTLNSLIQHGSDLVSKIEDFDYLILQNENEEEEQQE